MSEIIALPAHAVTVSPREIDEAVRARASELAGDRLSANTRRSYAAAINYVAGWWFARYRTPFPLPGEAWPIEAVITFVVDHSVTDDGRLHMAAQPDTAWIDLALVGAGIKGKPGPVKWSTLNHRLDVLAAAHVRHGLPDPTADTAVKDLLAGVRKNLDRLGLVRKRKATPLTQDGMAAMLATCDASPVGLRDRALLLFGWPRRRSEIADARIEHLVRRVDASTRQVSYVYALTGTKTQAAGEDALLIPIAGTAAEALDEWLSLLETHGHAVDAGPIFRILRGVPPKHVRITAQSMSPDTIIRMIKARATAAGLAPPSGRSFSGHSLRRGFVSEGVGKMPIHSVMAMTGQKTVRMVLEEYAEAEATKNPGARLFDL